MGTETTWTAMGSLVGRWEGGGVVEFPTLDPIPYREILEIAEGRVGPFLHYVQETWRQEDEGEIGSHHETGFISPGDDGTIHILNAQGSDRVELLQGTADINGDVLVIELKSRTIAGDARMIRSWRKLEHNADELRYTMGMATTQVPEGAIHLTARLIRR